MGLEREVELCLPVCPCVTCSLVSPHILVSPWLVHHRLHDVLVQDEAFTALGKVLYLLDGILDGQVGLP